jgi:hypothetical protein
MQGVWDILDEENRARGWVEKYITREMLQVGLQVLSSTFSVTSQAPSSG